MVGGCGFTMGTHRHHMSPDIPLISLHGPPHNEAYTQHQSDEEPWVRLVPKYQQLVLWYPGVEHQSCDMEEGYLVPRPTSRYTCLLSGMRATKGGTDFHTEQTNHDVNCNPMSGSFHHTQCQTHCTTRHTYMAATH